MSDALGAGPADALARLRASGIVEGAQRIPSPNLNARPSGIAIELLVIHNISLPPGVFRGNGIIELFTNRRASPQRADPALGSRRDRATSGQLSAMGAERPTTAGDRIRSAPDVVTSY